MGPTKVALIAVKHVDADREALERQDQASASMDNEDEVSDEEPEVLARAMEALVPAQADNDGAGEKDRAEERAVPSLDLLEKTPPWGCFTFSLKQAIRGKSRYGGYEVSCCWHKKSSSTACKKFVSLSDRTPAAMARALQVAKHWASQAKQYRYQWEHVHLANTSDVPSSDTLEQRCIHHRPGTGLVLTDNELNLLPNPQQPWQDNVSSSSKSGKPAAAAKAGAGSARAKAKGKGKAKPGGKATAKNRAANDEMQPAPGHAAIPPEHESNSSSSSSSGGSTSSSSSS